MEQLIYEIFKRNGFLSKQVKSYQPRKAQYEMAKVVFQSLKEEKHGLLEAGTGTGKSFGYCLPAAIWAMSEEKRVIVSTNTITLQNQLLQKELPLVKAVLADLNPEWGEQFRYELAKGRGNYICKRRLEEYLQTTLEKETPYAEQAQRIKALVPSMKNGDRREIPFYVPNELFEEIRGDADDCIGKESPFHDTCFIQLARKKLQHAQLIIVNHALFFTDLALRAQGTGVLPEYDAVILDEAHRIEDQVTNQFQCTISLELLSRLFFRFSRNRSHWARAVEDPDLKSSFEALYTKLYQQVVDLFAPLGRILAQREQHVYPLLRPIVEHYPFADLFKEAAEMILSKKKFLELEQGETETLLSMERYIQQIKDMDQQFRHVLLRLQANEWATWVEFTPPKKQQLLEDDVYWAHCLTLHSAPIEVAELLRDLLFTQKTALLTSATLTTQGNFDFVASRLGIDEYQGFQAASPFQYEDQALLVVPQHVPVPTSAQFDHYLMGAMKEILLQTKGRTFLLFTSYAQMNRIFADLSPWLEKNHMKGLLHEAGVSREQLLQDFKEEKHAVLFGCESFWEGVDVPGDDLICVVIAKLPFPVPTDPITKARIEKIERTGKSSFEEYSLPFSILKLKQGFGRLIRTKDDKGAVVILDTRIHTKKYGKKVIESLPAAPFSNDLQDIGEAMKRFQLI
jgi:ATP-dependent DNA helicase DinG